MCLDTETVDLDLDAYAREQIFAYVVMMWR